MTDVKTKSGIVTLNLSHLPPGYRERTFLVLGHLVLQNMVLPLSKEIAGLVADKMNDEAVRAVAAQDALIAFTQGMVAAKNEARSQGDEVDAWVEKFMKMGPSEFMEALGLETPSVADVSEVRDD